MHATRQNLLAILEQARTCLVDDVPVRLHDKSKDGGHCLVQDCAGLPCLWEGLFARILAMVIGKKSTEIVLTPCLGVQGAVDTGIDAINTAIFLLSNHICDDVPLIIAMIMRYVLGYHKISDLCAAPRLLRIETLAQERMCRLWDTKAHPDLQTLSAIQLIPRLKRHLDAPTLDPGPHEKCIQTADASLNAVREDIPARLFTAVTQLIVDVSARFSPPPPPPPPPEDDLVHHHHHNSAWPTISWMRSEYTCIIA